MILAILLAVVNAGYAPGSSACDGVNATFSVGFPYLSQSYVVAKSVTSGGAVTTLVAGADYTLSLASSSTTAVLTLNAPASSCPSGNTLKVMRSTPLTQPTHYTSVSGTTVEAGLDRLTMIAQEQSVTIPTVNGDLSSSTVLVAGSTTPVTMASFFTGMPVPLSAYGVTCNGSADDSPKIQACLNNQQACIIPAATCSVGTTTITIPSGKALLGLTPGSSILKYTGANCAVANDGGQFDILADFEIQALGNSATLHGLCFTNVGGPTLWNKVRNVHILGGQNPPVAGSSAVYVHSTTGNSLYYNEFPGLVTRFWDHSVELSGDVGSGGANANWFPALSSSVATMGVDFNKFASDNYVQGHCNAGGTAFAQTCVNTSGGAGAQSGNVTFMDSDQGASGQGFKLSATAVNNMIFDDNESTVASDLNGADSTNFVFTTKPLTGSPRKAFTPSAVFSGVNTLGTSAGSTTFIGAALQETDQQHNTDAGVTIASTAFFVGHNGNTVAHTDALTATSGQLILIYDEDGSMSGVKTLTLNAPAAGTVNGGATFVAINAAKGSALCYSSSADGKTWLCITH